MMKRVCPAAIVIAMLLVFTPSVGAIECGDIPVSDGCLFTITGGDTPDPDDGFSVTNAYGVPMWDFVRERDLAALGYPISQRWVEGPFTLQAFQKVILQWDPGEGRMNYYNTLDVLANHYPHVELPFVPAHRVLEADQGEDFGTITRNHLAILAHNAKIKKRFLAEPDWLNLYGLPIRYEEREVDGNPQGVQLLRTQRTVFVIWNVPAPGTTIGRVLLQNLPDQVKKISDVIIPDSAKIPAPSDGIRDLDLYFAEKLHEIMRYSDNGYAQLASQPWFDDGLDSDEKAWIVALSYYASFDVFADSIDLYHSQINTVLSPRGNEVNIWIFKRTPFGDADVDLADRVEKAVRVYEQFMQVSFPTTDIIILVTGSDDIGLGQIASNIDYNIFLPESQLGSLEHEVAHYYFSNSFGHTWLVEGGAEFLASYVRHLNDQESLDDLRLQLRDASRKQCTTKLGLNNVQHVIDYYPATISDEARLCAYYFGEYFLQEILGVIGAEAVGKSLGDLFVPQVSPGTLAVSTVTEEEAYRGFLDNAPAGSEEQLVDTYRRLHGGPFTSATAAAEAVPSIPTSIAAALSGSIPWVANPPDSDHARALRALASIWQIDVDLSTAIAQYTWIVDGISHKERMAIEHIAAIAEVDVELARLAADYSWIVDDIRYWEHYAARDLRRMVEWNYRLDGNGRHAMYVMSLPWLQDSLSLPEATAISLINGTHSAPFQRLPWIADNIQTVEAAALRNIHVFAQDEEMLEQVTSIPWIADGISTAEESQALNPLPWLFWKDPRIAKSIIGLSWTSNGWNFAELQALWRLVDIVEADLEVGWQVARHPWFVDDITEVEYRALTLLYKIVSNNIELARQVVGYPWVIDGIDESELETLSSLIRG